MDPPVESLRADVAVRYEARRASEAVRAAFTACAFAELDGQYRSLAEDFPAL